MVVCEDEIMCFSTIMLVRFVHVVHVGCFRYAFSALGTGVFSSQNIHNILLFAFVVNCKL